MSDNSLYTGYTKNIKNRLQQHSSGKGSKYTRSRLPCTLVYQEKYDTRSEAMKREYQIKQMRRDKKIRLINKKL